MTTSTQFMQMYGVTYGRALEMVAEERAANKAKKQARSAAVANSPITKAVEPLRADAIKAADQWTEKQIANVRAQLEKGNWDLNVVAPRADSYRQGRADYMKAQARRQQFEFLTKGRDKDSQSFYDRKQPFFVVMNEAKFELLRQQSRDAAAAQYDAFVEKLVYKIGETTSAQLDGNHVWSHSVLTVTKADGTVEKWKTQQITNVSKLGKYFPQWPSRKIKK